MSKIFNDSLKVGTEGENKVQALLERYGCVVKNIGEKKGRMDLHCTLAGYEFTVEVKNDVASVTTGNLFFEKVGIEALTADYIAYVSGDDIYFFKNEDAKKFLTLSFKTTHTSQEKVGSKVPYEGTIVPIKYSHPMDAETLLVMYIYEGDIRSFKRNIPKDPSDDIF